VPWFAADAHPHASSITLRASDRGSHIVVVVVEVPLATVVVELTGAAVEVVELVATAVVVVLVLAPAKPTRIVS